MGEDDNFMDKKKPHKSKHSGKLKIWLFLLYFSLFWEKNLILFFKNFRCESREKEIEESTTDR